MKEATGEMTVLFMVQLDAIKAEVYVIGFFLSVMFLFCLTRLPQTTASSSDCSTSSSVSTTISV